jgi:exopolysaccharide biosynthesis polyprenyl glycosylphosphotransferase
MRAVEAGQTFERRDTALRHRHLFAFLLSIAFVVLDVALVALAAVLAALLRQGTLDSGNWPQFVGVVLPAYLVTCAATGGYSSRVLTSFSAAAARALLAMAVAVSIGFCAAFALQVGGQISRLETAYAIGSALAFLLLARSVGARIAAPALQKGAEHSVTVVTDGHVPTEAWAGARVVNIHAEAVALPEGELAFFAYVGHLVRDSDRVVLILGNVQQRLRWAETMRLCGVNAEVVADLGGLKPIGLSRWSGSSTLVVSRGPMTLGERAAKRAFDLGLTLAAMPLALPLIAVAAAIIKLDSPGPAFFIQTRVGRNNRHYRCFKLRTMRHEASDPEGARSISPGDDRTTRIGRVLRRTSLDELPQLFNVLAGDMSLVGPRPHALGSTAGGALFWEGLPDYWTRHAMKPGVTGLAQVRGLRGPTQTREDLERRLAADLEYINSWSPLLDLRLLLRTVAVVAHRNAF